MQLSTLPEGIWMTWLTLTFACLAPPAICHQCPCFYFFEGAHSIFKWWQGCWDNNNQLIKFCIVTRYIVWLLGSNETRMHAGSDVPMPLTQRGIPNSTVAHAWWLHSLVFRVMLHLFCPLPSRMPLNFSLKKILSPVFRNFEHMKMK